jgi:5-methylcytosine-specific restriction protein A
MARVFDRDADVVAEVLARANGKCEGCGAIAPFTGKAKGEPYLEVHHIVPLAENGDDTVENAVALCPNCHRHRHFGREPWKQAY